MPAKFVRRIGTLASLGLAGWLVPQIALAADGGTPAATLVSGLVTAATLAIGVLNFFAWFALSILDHIMDPQYIFSLNADGTDGSLLNMLHVIWQFTRDIVNLGFAIGLVVFAILMIISADFTKIKEHLPKFVVGLVLVNFSWFIPRVVFDFSQVLTYTVYQIPSLLGADNCRLPMREGDAQPQPCKVVLAYKFFDHTRTVGRDGVDRPPNGRETRGWSCPLPGVVCVQMVPLSDPNNPNAGIDNQVNTATKVLDGLVVNHARLQWLAQVQFQDARLRLAPDAGLRQIFMGAGAIIIKLLIILVLHVAIVFPLVAMVAAFFIRIPVLWVSMAFMPLVALGYAFPKLKEGEYKDLFWGWIDHFMKAVFLPVRVAIPFSIGFIMLNAGAAVAAPPGFGDIPLIPVFIGVRDLWQFIWMAIAMFIIWEYSFKALKGDEAGFMGHFTETIQGFGSSLGALATQAPLSVPWIPMMGRTQQNPHTGQQEAVRISPLQALHGLSPQRLLSDLHMRGRFSGVDEHLGLQRQQNTALTFINNSPVTANVTQQLQTAAAANDPVAMQRALEPLVKQAGSNAAFGTMTQRQTIELMIQNNRTLTEEQRKQILAIVQGNNVFNTTRMVPNL